jgi:hypothetical protein
MADARLKTPTLWLPLPPETQRAPVPMGISLGAVIKVIRAWAFW